MQPTDNATIYYFGYGANRSKQRITDILQEEPKGGFGALVTGYALWYQTVQQIPDPPRMILQQTWGDAFRCYTLRPHDHGMVTGVLWKLSADQFQKMQQWELIGSWKQLVRLKAKIWNGELYDAYTEMVPETQSAYLATDGLDYTENLNSEWKPVLHDDAFRIKKTRELLGRIAGAK